MADSRPRFLFVVPVFQSVYATPFANFIALAMRTAADERDRYSFDTYVPARQLLHSAMNLAGAIVLEHGFDGMVLADDDCTSPPDGISRLLRHYEAGHPIVSAAGFMRNYPYTTTVGRYYDRTTIHFDPVTRAPKLAGFAWVDDLSTEPADLVQADFCGFPLTLITADALRAMERPWFGTFIDGGECTHDVYFGSRAKAAKLPIVVDRTIRCGHLADADLVTFDNRDLARGVRRAVEQAHREMLAEAQSPTTPSDQRESFEHHGVIR